MDQPNPSNDVLFEKCNWLEKEVRRLERKGDCLEKENKHQSKMIYIGFGLAVAVNFIAPFLKNGNPLQ